jgi:hypothetical protein
MTTAEADSGFDPLQTMLALTQQLPGGASPVT